MAVLEDGKIIEQGSVREIFSNPKSRTGALFAKVFQDLQVSFPERSPLVFSKPRKESDLDVDDQVAALKAVEA